MELMKFQNVLYTIQWYTLVKDFYKCANNFSWYHTVYHGMLRYLNSEFYLTNVFFVFREWNSKSRNKYSSSTEERSVHLEKRWRQAQSLCLASSSAFLRVSVFPSSLSLARFFSFALPFSLVLAAVTVTVFRGTTPRWIFLWPLSLLLLLLPLSSLSFALEP